MKKIISIFTAVIIAAFTVIPSFAQQISSAKLYNVYGDGMLFQQNKEAILAGTGNAGDKIACELKDNSGTVIASSSSTVARDNTFSVSFTAPAGSYDEYTIELKANGEIFDTLDNILFGELWLSSGQSNMQLELVHTKTGKEMLENGTRGSKYVRYFYSAPLPDYNGTPNALPYEPQKEIRGCYWFDGTSDSIFNISGVGYFFAEKLQQDLDMPVGLLSGSLGGSSIIPWLPRDYVENDSKALKIMGDRFYSKKEWTEDGSLSPMTTCSGMYNLKIAPLENFRPAGMIWYQGESDAGWDYGSYSKLFDILQDSYTDKFDYKNGKMPVVISALANYPFAGNSGLQYKTAEFSVMQASRPESRSLISISDLPLTYRPESQTVHPIEKKPVGERMAYAAEGMLYNSGTLYSSPNMKKSEIKDGAIYITFNYCGDGLKSKADRIYGFTVCGKNGVYVPAKAEIVSEDTVKVYNEDIKSPVAAMYAGGLITGRCNLFATQDGEFVWPVLPTVTDWSYSDNIWDDFGWLDCDVSEIWREETLTTAGSYTVWESENADVEITADSAFYGEGGLKISASSDSFSVSPITSYYDEYDKTVNRFVEFNKEWQHFNTLSVMLRNDGDKDVSLENIKIYYDEDKWVSPVVKNTLKTDCLIPADGQWHKVTFTLDTLAFSGKILPVAASRTFLNDVRDVEFCFEGENAEISMDEISFTTTGLSSPVLKLMGIGPVSILFNLINLIIGLFRM